DTFAGNGWRCQREGRAAQEKTSKHGTPLPRKRHSIKGVGAGAFSGPCKRNTAAGAAAVGDNTASLFIF
ncbi:MAG: hypothetical protein RSB42_16905, partial [Comamonas sp.]